MEQIKNVKVSDCEIKREDGNYSISFENEIIHEDWYNERYDWLGLAISVINSLAERHRTLYWLLTVRRALREDCVQGWNEQDSLIWDFRYEHDNRLTLSQLLLFISIARKNDKIHHGNIHSNHQKEKCPTTQNI